MTKQKRTRKIVTLTIPPEIHEKGKKLAKIKNKSFSQFIVDFIMKCRIINNNK